MTSPLRILVVDDERLIRWSMAEHLARNAYDVTSAEDGEQALQALASRPFDLMLLDVRLPGIDGLTALRRALTALPDLAVIMMSAHSNIDIAVEAMKHGALDFLVKPFPFVALDAAIERAVSALNSRRQVAACSGQGPQRGVGAFLGVSPQAEEVRRLVLRVAASGTTTALIEGESGSGKDVVAKAIHAESARADKPFMQVNCAAMPEQLLESELFGHERGAFTDAKTQKAGLFETANGGSVMLDEIGDLPAGGQAKLLLLLEGRRFRRVGGTTEQSTNVRVIAATNVDLEQRVAAGRFRADLFFRLNVVRIQVPPLRERKADIVQLASHFVSRFNDELKRNVREISPEAMELLVAYHWPGNVRELRNVLERAFILHTGAEEIRPEHLPVSLRIPEEPSTEAPAGAEASLPSLDQAERKLIVEAMERARGNQSQAARLLNVSRDTLRYRLKKFGLS